LSPPRALDEPLTRLHEWHLNAVDLVTLFARAFDNVTLIDATKSKWHVAGAAVAVVSASRQRRQAYRTAVALQKPALIAGLCVPPTKVAAHTLPQFGHYCPVCWAQVGLGCICICFIVVVSVVIFVCIQSRSRRF
jgi:hypothetical protein